MYRRPPKNGSAFLVIVFIVWATMIATMITVIKLIIIVIIIMVGAPLGRCTPGLAPLLGWPHGGWPCLQTRA